MAFTPADLLGAHREIFLPLRVGGFRPEVAKPELERIDLEPIRELVDHGFGDEARLRMAGSAERALRSGVDVDVAMALAP